MKGERWRGGKRQKQLDCEFEKWFAVRAAKRERETRAQSDGVQTEKKIYTSAGITGGPIRATNSETWGRQSARSRYGESRPPTVAVRDLTAPQTDDNRSGAQLDNNVRDGWLRSNAEAKPGFDRSEARQPMPMNPAGIGRMRSVGQLAAPVTGWQHGGSDSGEGRQNKADVQRRARGR
jgi:hypothetical protein